MSEDGVLYALRNKHKLTKTWQKSFPYVARTIAPYLVQSNIQKFYCIPFPNYHYESGDGLNETLKTILHACNDLLLLALGNS